MQHLTILIIQKDKLRVHTYMFMGENIVLRERRRTSKKVKEIRQMPSQKTRPFFLAQLTELKTFFYLKKNTNIKLKKKLNLFPLKTLQIKLTLQ
jgi:hypothetical protein